MMRDRSSYSRFHGNRQRPLLLLTLAMCLLLPKLSLSAALLFGDGYRTVLLCNGSQLVRVVLSPDGSLVGQDDEASRSPHCLLTIHDIQQHERAWYRASYAQRMAILRPRHEQLPAQPPIFRQCFASRGPPLI